MFKEKTCSKTEIWMLNCAPRLLALACTKIAALCRKIRK
uniref:Uncharacterized protein n=1 Tax=Heterorhabditis bacteriophora TaxID=37862 RepID=A0A1I7WF99_HETBA